MADMKNINEKALIERLVAAGDDARDSITRAVSAAIEEVRTAARALEQMPRSTSDLLVKATLALAADFEPRSVLRGWNAARRQS
jgi:hypothetical protein